MFRANHHRATVAWMTDHAGRPMARALITERSEGESVSVVRPNTAHPMKIVNCVLRIHLHAKQSMNEKKIENHKCEHSRATKLISILRNFQRGRTEPSMEEIEVVN